MIAISVSEAGGPARPSQAGPFWRQRVPRSASTMVSATAAGWLTEMACDDFTSMTCALARLAVHRCPSGSMALS
ncbi:hypothetical protein ACIBG8_43210 [Nonomuraea sp. NPDC050556]|uniref:hypothetical protein n=1 Tax=Nonomuraea sp. NPDC050556 TaxID=3364369 RepID=UPI00378E8FB3